MKSYLALFNGFNSSSYVQYDKFRVSICLINILCSPAFICGDKIYNILTIY